MRSEKIKQSKPKRHFSRRDGFQKHRDNSLLLLQKSITSKISKTKDETLIRYYLQRTNKISELRLALQKRSAVSERTSLEGQLLGNEIKKLYEDVRDIFLQTEKIQSSINEIKHKKLHEVLSEMLKISQDGLMVFLNTTDEFEQCETDSEINELLKCFPVLESEVIH